MDCKIILLFFDRMDIEREEVLGVLGQEVDAKAIQEVGGMTKDDPTGVVTGCPIVFL